jgi:hypothetical protein
MEQVSLEDLPCAKKLPFKTKDEADIAAVYAKYRYDGAKPHAYKCRYCERWHLSSNPVIKEEQ